jgi:hypothetical protein
MWTSVHVKGAFFCHGLPPSAKMGGPPKKDTPFFASRMRPFCVPFASPLERNVRVRLPRECSSWVWKSNILKKVTSLGDIIERCRRDGPTL